MKKIVFSLSIVAIFASLIAFAVYSQYQLRQEPVVYSFDIQTEDFSINDIVLVAYPNSLYVAGNYYLEMIGDNKQFDGIGFELSIRERSIMSLSQAGHQFDLPHAAAGKIYVDSYGVLNGITIRKNDIVDVDIRYNINGRAKKVVGEIKLIDVVKPFSSTGDRAPIIL
ncbi:hypothetical protein [Paenibacillus sp. GCM10028914]|uniref:hypothetical protein n=1 Tax=Paenibacillus sp. GCM10028914 TaxID=3273416 RepID=UPI003621AE12